MDFELAKQLKDAGFPQKEANGFSGIIAHVEEVADDSLYYPTLSELIGACGEYFCLERHSNDWRAGRLKVGGTNIVSSGSNPEEAVARLWLALNAKV